jgi:hypothetical protein
VSVPTPLPDGIPGTVTLDQLKGIVGSFGYALTLTAAPTPPVPPGFASPLERDPS